MSSSKDTGVGAALKTPLINIDVDYRTFVYNENEEYLQEELDTQSATSKDISFRDNKRILIDDQKVLLDFLEENIDLKKENFDIEFYVVEEETVDVSNGDGEVIREERESLRRLRFAPSYDKFSDKKEYIDTYFHIEFDAEISESDFADKGTDDVLSFDNNIKPSSTTGNENLIGNLYDNFDSSDDEGCD